MSVSKDLLFELGTEELPPKSLLKLSRSLLANIQNGLEKAELSFAACHAFATPRRLGIIVEQLSASQPDKTVEKRGPAMQAAFTADGVPSKAAEGFAKSCSTTVAQLGRIKTDKGEWLAYSQQVKGQPTAILIADIISQSIQNLPIAKRMRWGAFSTEFVRPVHWAVLLYGSEVIDAEILGLTTGNQTQGHRFHAPGLITLNNAQEYQSKLYQQGKVIVDFEQRQTIIRNATIAAAEKVGGMVQIDAELLEEITALNEWPVPIVGNFDRRYLELPAEVLITTMQINQKYFPVKNQAGQLLPHFITFSNIESTRHESIQRGNERVILPRLADAEFFWKQDRKRRLDERVLELGNIVFQQKLGTLADKTRRVESLAGYIAQALNVDPVQAKRAALLSKTDLLTEMVGEFPSLQGIMGRYYAAADGESDEVALALEEQYFPKQSGAATPSGITGQILAIAEKTDTLAGIFSAGLIPTGDKDPYALRRAALGMLRIIIEKELDLNIVALIDFACSQYTHNFDLEETRKQIIAFVVDRLKGYCLDLGFNSDEFEAVLAVNPEKPLDFVFRLQAVKAFRQLAEAESLASANKRIRNILRKADTGPALTVDVLTAAEEIALLNTAKQAEQDIQPLLAQRNYQAALNRLALLRNDVDAFFDNVMVMVDDPGLRASRLGLLAMLADLFLQIADISKLQS
jgi:glycyl-tRNA synthetase beta chain